MKAHYLVEYTIDLPYPKKFSYRIEASNHGRALDFGYRKLRKELPKKRLGRIYNISCSEPIRSLEIAEAHVPTPCFDREKTAQLNRVLNNVFRRMP